MVLLKAFADNTGVELIELEFGVAGLQEIEEREASSGHGDWGGKGREGSFSALLCFEFRSCCSEVPFSPLNI